jgi:formate dehydrogenase gamma subunit
LIKSVYLWLIALIVGGMLLHNVVILSYYVIKRRRVAMSAESILRLDRVQRIQHVGLLVSFWLLVVTGFALRFPDAWWVQQLSVVGMTEPVRSTLHRIGAAVMVVVSLSHLWYIISVKRGRKEFQAMLPELQDVKDFWANMKYYTWRSGKRAKFGRYGYTQKAEYWALVWGTVIMALTGFVLWFPTLAVRFLPAIAVTVSQTIHYYEAWLATLAIVVWHLFFVLFYPGEYPMNWTWLTGKMSHNTVEEHHGRWYEEEIAHIGEGSGASSEA